MRSSPTILDRTSIQPRSAVLAVAGPVDGDEIQLTNCPWVVRPRAMIENLGLHDVVVLNDFEAQALAVVALGEEHMEKIGPGTPEPTAGRVVLGPGTGLGVAGLIHACHRWIPVPGEGGHMDIGPRTPRDHEVFPHIERIEGRISGRAASVRPRPCQYLPGCRQGRWRCAALHDAGRDHRRSTREVGQAWPRKRCPCSSLVLGAPPGDLAFVFMSRGGVYLTGGIAQKIVPALKSGNFRDAFEDKAPHKELMRDMPVYVITHPLAALSGLAAYARTPVRFGVETSGRRWKG